MPWNICRGRVNCEVQTVNWEAGKERGCWDKCQEQRHINRELEAKQHKPWTREGLNREVQTVNQALSTSKIPGLRALEFVYSEMQQPLACRSACLKRSRAGVPIACRPF